MEPPEGQMPETLNSTPISTKRRRIAELAKAAPGKAFTSLAHFIDLDWMHEAYRLTRKDGATGVDGQTAEAYAMHLEDNLRSLLDRAKSGRYRAPPVRRVNIPKPDGSTRPLGIPTFEDKVLQRAVAMVLESVYEQSFMDCSYGFRPGRSAHHALDALSEQAMAMRGGWVLDVDIRRFFDTLDHGRLRAFLAQRVRDGVIARLIGKWLNAGVMEAGRLVHPESGTPQGGVISPLLANLYLHEVLDTWFERDVKPRLKGRGFLVRYADDFVMCFEHEHDARRVLDVLPKRFGKYGLTLHPDKTRILSFHQPRPRHWRKRGDDPPSPGNFDFLGFTHHWCETRNQSHWVLRQATAKSRFTRSLAAVRQWCREHRHWPLEAQHRMICAKLRGHFGYYGLPGNSRALGRFKLEVFRAWWAWLARRSQRQNLARLFGAVSRLSLPVPTIKPRPRMRVANP